MGYVAGQYGVYSRIIWGMPIMGQYGVYGWIIWGIPITK